MACLADEAKRALKAGATCKFRSHASLDGDHLVIKSINQSSSCIRYLRLFTRD
jgi:hypothetical protein